MIHFQLFFFCIILFFLNKIIVNNIKISKKCTHLNKISLNKKSSRNLNYNKLFFLFLKNTKKCNENKRKRIYFERNGINVPKDIAMFGRTNVYYIRESIYNKDKNNLVENEINSLNIEELNDIDNNNIKNTNVNSSDLKNIGDKNNSYDFAEVNSNTSNINNDINYAKNEKTGDNVFNYINKKNDYVVQVGNSPKVDVYERTYKADEKTMHRIFENVNEVNLQLLKDIKSIDEKEKLINKKVIEKVREDIKRYQETNEIMDVKGNFLKPNSEKKSVSKNASKEKNSSNTDMDEEEKNEVLKKLYMNDKKTDKYIEENVYFVIQTWLPDIKIDDTLIIIDNIEKFYNDFDISKYYEKFKEVKNNNFSYDLSSYEIENVPKNINDDTEIECEHVHSYNNTYNKLNNYNLKRYTYTYKTNDNIDTTFNKNEPMPPIVLINTKKNLMVQEWECKNFKNRQKRNKSYEYTRIQRAFRPFSYVDLSDISCIYKNNFLQLKMKLSHRKYKNDIYPFFVPINRYSNELLDFNGYKQNGDNAWSFFWHNFDYDKNTDYSFLNKNIKLNITETKFEEVNKKKSKKIMRKILKERKGI
ncbi:conserved Plasmodium protein, unknown function [Plasmodium gallinaceum]|uniref:Uncharacterized protein n=1 Tax=Plasmodium gallinaceum TaxID=5849 RepID=A0A1J1GWJ2_PLAGA|nr:conserved Plasmodium protein, unknown function [Plasmodium gallinaceum]CRG96685.1 conserved Plasmodium protein, unknown function [Plasmodium gallinaceum]